MSRLLSFLAGALLGAATALAPHVVAQRQWRPPMPTGGVRTPLPAWLQTPPVAIDVRWIRAHGLPEVRDGVCVLYMADHERGLEYAEDQVTHCLRHGARAVATPSAGTVRLHWHPVADSLEAAQRYGEVYAGLVSPRIVGFYLHTTRGQPCHVVTVEREFALGHELKHCFDGNWHPAKQHGAMPR